MTELDQLGRIAGAMVVLIELGLLIGLKLRRRNLMNLEAEKIELLGVAFFVLNESSLLFFQSSALAEQAGKCLAEFPHAAECVEDGQLFGGVQQGLVVVGSMNIHEPFSQHSQNVERGRRTIDELAVCSIAGEGPLQDELIVLARFQAIFVQKTTQGRPEQTDVKYGLHRTTLAAATDQGALGAFTDHQIKGADDDGLAGARLAGDSTESRLEFQGQVSDQSQVFDAQDDEHDKNSFVLNLAVMLVFGKRNLGEICQSASATNPFCKKALE